jgi:hypothetical protein
METFGFLSIYIHHTCEWNCGMSAMPGSRASLPLGGPNGLRPQERRLPKAQEKGKKPPNKNIGNSR